MDNHALDKQMAAMSDSYPCDCARSHISCQFNQNEDCIVTGLEKETKDFRSHLTEITKLAFKHDNMEIIEYLKDHNLHGGV